MRITVKIKPGSKCDLVEKMGENEFTVRVKAPPIDGKANKSLIDILSKHFKVPKRSIMLLRGHTGKLKILSIS